MIILNGYNNYGYDEGLLGDSIMGIPIIEELALREPGNVFMTSTNQEVATLIPKRFGIRSMHELSTSSNHTVYKVSVHEMFEKYRHDYHPTQSFYGMFGLPIPSQPVRPEIEFTDDLAVPTYDFVISGISRANGVRMWPLENWPKLFTKLREIYPDCSIVMPGPAGEKQPFTEIDYYLGYSLEQVACLLSRARKAVITIDNGISRLMHAVGGNHILLCSNAVRYEWGTYPEAYVLYGSPSSWTVDQVVEQVLESTKVLNV